MEPLVWHAAGNEFRCPPYTIVLARPGRWELRRRGRHQSIHRGLAAAGAAAAELERRRRRRLRLWAWTAAAALALAVIAAAMPFRTIDNPEHAPAAAFVAPLEQAYYGIGAGTATVDDFDRPNLRGGTITVSIAALDPEAPDIERTYLVLTAEYAEGSCTGRFADYTSCPCYVLRWLPGHAAFAGVLAPTLPCDPNDTALMGEWSYDRFSPGQAAGPGVDWEAVLPPRQLQALWFLPLLIGVFVVCLQALVGATVTLYRFRSVGISNSGLDPDLLTGTAAAAGNR
jgi:hypothetical protein